MPLSDLVELTVREIGRLPLEYVVERVFYRSAFQ
jgi:hypothetical protein